jgi:hypothetical protein
MCPLCKGDHTLSQCPRWKVARFPVPPVPHNLWTNLDWIRWAGLEPAK